MLTHMDKKLEFTQLASQLADPDLRVGLRAVAALGRLHARLEELYVTKARQEGLSWQDVANCLGVTRQTVHRKYARRLK